MQQVTLTFRKTNEKELALMIKKHGEENGRAFLYTSVYRFNKELCQNCEQKIVCLVDTPCMYRQKDGYTVHHTAAATVKSVLDYWKKVFKEI